MKNSRVCITVSSYKVHKWDKMFNMQSKGEVARKAVSLWSFDFIEMRSQSSDSRPQTPYWLQCQNSI